MTHKSAKTVSRGKGDSLPRPRSGGLTCTERQVDDVLSAGESTDVERIPANALSRALSPGRPAVCNDKH
jgi:hypothetical protein